MESKRNRETLNCRIEDENEPENKPNEGLRDGETLGKGREKDREDVECNRSGGCADRKETERGWCEALLHPPVRPSIKEELEYEASLCDVTRRIHQV